MTIVPPHPAEIAYLPGASPPDDPSAAPGAVPRNPLAQQYLGQRPRPEPVDMPPPPPTHMADAVPPQALPPPADAAPPADAVTPAVAVSPLAGSQPMHASHEVRHPSDLPAPPSTVDDNPFGDFFADGPSAWLGDDDDEPDVATDRRILGTLLAAMAAASLAAAWIVWVLAMLQGAGGAEAGGFVLVSMLLWIWYLSLPREQQHRPLLRLQERITARIDGFAGPLRVRTGDQLVLRRERERYRAMRDERGRRVASLGEAAYRAFRQGTLPHELHGQSQRVMAMEQQMMMQDHRIHGLVTGPGGRTDPATDQPDGGHRMS